MTDLLEAKATPLPDVLLPDQDLELFTAGINQVLASSKSAYLYKQHFSNYLDPNTTGVVDELQAPTAILSETDPRIPVDNILNAGYSVRNHAHETVRRRVVANQNNGAKAAVRTGVESHVLDITDVSLDPAVDYEIDAVVDEAITEFGRTLFGTAESLKQAVAESGAKLDELAKQQKTNIVARGIRWLRSSPGDSPIHSSEVPIKDRAGERNVRKLSAELTGLSSDLVNESTEALVKRINNIAQAKIDRLASELLASKRAEESRMIGSRAIGALPVAEATRPSKKAARRAARTMAQATQTVPAPEDSVEVIPEKPLGLGSIKQGPDGQRVLEPMTAEQLIESKSVPNEVRGEIARMLEEVRRDPRGVGTKRLVTNKGRNKVFIDAEEVPVLRFSPTQRPGFTTTKVARRYRIVYGVHGDVVGVIDILHHDDFDSRYS